jgi:PhnB protein
MLIEPYLFFDGRCEEAIAFYKKAIGAEVEMMMRFSESPEPCDPGMVPPGAENKVMHASLRIGDSRVMASDGNCAGKPKFEGVSLAITVPTVADANRVFASLGDGGQVTMPLSETFWSPSFGMLADRFGVNWMIYVVKKD